VFHAIILAGRAQRPITPCTLASLPS